MLQTQSVSNLTVMRFASLKYQTALMLHVNQISTSCMLLDWDKNMRPPKRFSPICHCVLVCCPGAERLLWSLTPALEKQLLFGVFVKQKLCILMDMWNNVTWQTGRDLTGLCEEELHLLTYHYVIESDDDVSDEIKLRSKPRQVEVEMHPCWPNLEVFVFNIF